MIDSRISRAAEPSPSAQAAISTVLLRKNPDSRPSARENVISNEWVMSAATVIVTAAASAVVARRSSPRAMTPAASMIPRTNHGVGDGPGIQSRAPVTLTVWPSTVSGIIQV